MTVGEEFGAGLDVVSLLCSDDGPTVILCVGYAAYGAARGRS